MSKDIVILVLSPFNNRSLIEYSDTNKAFIDTCKHTNEASLKYMDWKLKNANKKIDVVYVFTSDMAKQDLDNFKSLFAEYNFSIKEIPLYNNGNLAGSFMSITAMSDELREYIKKNNEEITIHIDMTGGPRHCVMLLMVLIQMVKFAGAKIGMVTYANILGGKNKGIIEEVNDIMDMFSLIGGAEEFVSFGSISQIQKYFTKAENISESLKYLLRAMENLSETIKVCGNYESMKNTLLKLSECIQSYEVFYQENKQNLIEKELFFGKLLPTIKEGYEEILPYDEQPATPVQIIRWCANREFLQQATIFYTEWLPDYLIKYKLVEVTSKDLIAECEKAKLEWSSWPIHLFRNYVIPSKQTVNKKESVMNISADRVTYKDLQILLNSNLSMEEIKVKVKNKNIKFEAFLQKVINFNKMTTWWNFSRKVKALDDDDPIKIILKKAANKNISFTNYLDKRIKETLSVPNLILSSTKKSGKALCKELFDIEDVNKKVNTAEEKGKNRVKIFEELLKAKSIKSNIPVDDLLKFVGQYSEYVNQWRNKFSHAVSEDANKEENKGIAKSIISSIDLIDINKGRCN